MLAGLDRASGGELARLFLAVGMCIARSDTARGASGRTPGCFIFDEVDQNVGARLGAAVGACLAGIGRRRQVLVITHLAPVAARADRHLRVVKEKGRAQIVVVTGDARLEELALMIRGAPVTKASLEQAAELLREGRKRRRRKVNVNAA